MFDLTGRRILVTGASGALGQSMTEFFHKQGAVVALAGRNLGALEALKEKLGGKNLHLVSSDLSVEADVDALVEKSAEKMGGIDTLVNNAGITKDGLVLTMKLEDWSTVLRLDLEVAYRLSKAALRPMLKERFGRIINISSVVGVMGNPGQANYAAAKAGLIGFSKSLAREVAGRNVTVNCIAPGFIASAMTDVLTPDQRDKINQGIPMGRIGNPEDVANVALFLASKESSYMTGQVLHVNGGMCMI